MAQTAQDYSNHTKFDPTFHFFLLPVFLISVIVSIYEFVRMPGFLSLWIIVFTAAVLIAAFKSRIYSLKVQDRVIRLEERLRLATIVPASQQGQVDGLTERQLIALRFASDKELPALAPTRCFREPEAS